MMESPLLISATNDQNKLMNEYEKQAADFFLTSVVKPDKLELIEITNDLANGKFNNFKDLLINVFKKYAIKTSIEKAAYLINRFETLLNMHAVFLKYFSVLSANPDNTEAIEVLLTIIKEFKSCAVDKTSAQTNYEGLFLDKYEVQISKIQQSGKILLQDKPDEFTYSNIRNALLAFFKYQIIPQAKDPKESTPELFKAVLLKKNAIIDFVEVYTSDNLDKFYEWLQDVFKYTTLDRSISTSESALLQQPLPETKLKFGFGQFQEMIKHYCKIMDRVQQYQQTPNTKENVLLKIELHNKIISNLVKFEATYKKTDFFMNLVRDDVKSNVFYDFYDVILTERYYNKGQEDRLWRSYCYEGEIHKDGYSLTISRRTKIEKSLEKFVKADYVQQL